MHMVQTIKEIANCVLFCYDFFKDKYKDKVSKTIT